MKSKGRTNKIRVVQEEIEAKVENMRP